MQMPDEVFDLLRRYAAKYPPPQGEAGETHENNCRLWTRRFAEQVAFSFPFASYGTKSASPTRPQSKDGIARLDGATLWGWDILVGAGTGHPSIPDAPPAGEDITGQSFIPVEPRNWLDGPPPVVVPPPEDDDNHCLLCSQCLDVLKAQAASANEQRQVLIQIASKLATYEELRALVAEVREYYIKNQPIVKVRF